MVYDNYYIYDISEDYYEDNIPDSYFLDAIDRIEQIYNEDKNRVFYIRQLQVLLEKDFFHWVTYNALKALIDRGDLKEVKYKKNSGTPINFIVHHSNRYFKRDINEMYKVIRKYSQDHITRSCGHRAEDLFFKAMALKGFVPVAQKVNEYEGKKWTRTGHDLDFLFKKDKIVYGCEIKNTLGYISKEELIIKKEMCKYWGIKPLFIMRYSPKTYNDLVINSGGFVLIFETQLYELSQEKLVEEIKNLLGLPVICSKAIPEGIIKRFEKWHNKNFVNSK